MFKKITTVIIATACLCAVWFVNNRPLFSSMATRFEVYATSNGSDGVIYDVCKDEYPLITLKYGEACVLPLEEGLEERLLSTFNAKVVFCENTQFGKSIYAFSPDVKYSKQIKGLKVNLQIFIGESNVKIGSPLIYGSY